MLLTIQRKDWDFYVSPLLPWRTQTLRWAERANFVANAVWEEQLIGGIIIVSDYTRIAGQRI